MSRMHLEVLSADESGKLQNGQYPMDSHTAAVDLFSSPFSLSFGTGTSHASNLNKLVIFVNLEP